jgi:cobalt-zinc-cadmium efflux system outer membrane protein
MTKLPITGWIAMILLLLPISSTSQESEGDDGLDYYISDPLLEEFIRGAIDANPHFRAMLSEYRAAIQKIPQVTALPDPMLTFTQFIRSPETRVGPQTHSLTISQRFPWFGKLDLQGKIAVREASARYEQYRAYERQLAARVKDAFYELGYLDRSIEIAGEEQLVLEYYEQLAETRYATGGGLQHEVIKVQTEITKILDRLEILSEQRDTVVSRLNTLRSRRPEEPIPPPRPVGPAELPTFMLDLERLYGMGEANRPELRAALDAIEGDELGVELSRKDYWPDVTVSAGLINVDGREDLSGRALPPPDNGKNAYNFSVGINIPIRRDKYRAAELAAGERVIAGRDRYDAIADEMRFEIQTEVNRIETLNRQLDLYERVLIPQAEGALRSVETAYETGLTGALDLLDSERVLLNIRLAQERFVSDYMKALSRLEFALGTRFPQR